MSNLTIGVTNSCACTFRDFFRASSLSSQAVIKLSQILNLLGLNQIDEETGLGILRSYESKFGAADDSAHRLDRFHGFLTSMQTKEGILDSIKSVGLYSKSEMEEYAKETGDWGHFLKRVDSEKSESVKGESHELPN